jgi:hypothetical protein
MLSEYTCIYNSIYQQRCVDWSPSNQQMTDRMHNLNMQHMQLERPQVKQNRAGHPPTTNQLIGMSYYYSWN